MFIVDLIRVGLAYFIVAPPSLLPLVILLSLPFFHPLFSLPPALSLLHSLLIVFLPPPSSRRSLLLSIAVSFPPSFPLQCFLPCFSPTLLPPLIMNHLLAPFLSFIISYCCCLSSCTHSPFNLSPFPPSLLHHFSLPFILSP